MPRVKRKVPSTPTHRFNLSVPEDIWENLVEVASERNETVTSIIMRGIRLIDEIYSTDERVFLVDGEDNEREVFVL